jgi:hypothetical protein
MAQIIEITDEQFSNFPEGFLDALGRLTVEFGRVEYLVKLTFKQLHGLPFSEGLALAEGHRQFSELCSEVKKGAERNLTDAEQREKLMEVVGDLLELSRERNDMVHAFWFEMEAGSMQRTRVELDKKTRTLDWSKSMQFGTTDVRSLAEQLRVCREYLQELRQQWPEIQTR